MRPVDRCWMRAPAAPSMPPSAEWPEWWATPYDAFGEWALVEAHRLPWVAWVAALLREAYRSNPDDRAYIGRIGVALVPFVARSRALSRLLALFLKLECRRVRLDLASSMWITRQTYCFARYTSSRIHRRQRGS